MLDFRTNQLEMKDEKETVFRGTNYPNTQRGISFMQAAVTKYTVARTNLSSHSDLPISAIFQKINRSKLNLQTFLNN